jgi:hypothetical protein
LALLGYGTLRLLTGVPPNDLLSLGLWLVAAVVIHDGLVSPTLLGIGSVLTRLPARVRRFVQAGLIVSGLLVVLAAPLIHRAGTQPPSKALLVRDYGVNLAVLIVMVASVSAIGYAWSVARARRAGSR